MESAGETGGGAGMAFMGMGTNAAGGMVGAMQQNGETPQSQYIQQQPQQQQATEQQAPTSSEPKKEEDPYDKLLKLKKLLDKGIITQEEFDKEKSKILG